MTQQPTYGRHTSYPLSELGTKLLCEGRYDKYEAGEPSPVGNRRELNIAGYALPIQELYQRLAITPQQIAEFCERWRLSELALFGSVLREDFRANSSNPSDIDFLFSYLPGSNMSLLRRARMKLELESLLKRKVDLLMTIEVMDSANPIRKKEILESAQVIYVKR